MKWQVKIGNEQIELEHFQNFSLSDWSEVRAGDQLWQAKWSDKLQCLFLRKPGSQVEYPVRIQGIHRQQDTHEFTTNVEFEAYYKQERIEIKAESMLKVPGMDARQKAKASAGAKIKAPMVGKILSIRTQEGARVEKGDELLVIEAMKMENKIFAPQAGIIEKLQCQVGQQTKLGEELLRISAIKIN